MKRTVFAAALAFATTAAFAGNSYHFETTMTGTPQAQSMSGLVEAENGKMRTTFTRGDGMLFPDNSFALSTDGRTLNVYNPAAKTYYDLSPEQLSGSTTAMLDQLRQMFQLTISNAKVASRNLGDGGMVEGFPTKHTAVDASYDVNIDAMGQKMTMSTSSTIESWTTDKLPSTLSNFVQMQGFHTGIPELDKLLQAQAAAMTGFPLKQVIHTHVVQNGQNVDMTQTTVVSDLVTKPIPASEFTAPQGYTKVENPLDKMLASMKKQ